MVIIWNPVSFHRDTSPNTHHQLCQNTWYNSHTLAAGDGASEPAKHTGHSRTLVAEAFGKRQKSMKGKLMPQVSKLMVRPIAFHPIFAEITGDVLAGLLLSQANYWSTVTTDPDGWFYKTQKEWQKETCMSRSNQDTARRILRKHSWWEENLTGIPAKLHYRINHELLSQAMLDHHNKIAETLQTEEIKEPVQFVGIQQTGLSESSNTACGNAANITESTQRVPESTFVENPKANFPLANGDDESVHAQQAGSALDLSKIVENGFTRYGLNNLMHIGSSKTEPAPSVHANGGYATPPEVAAPPPAQNGQLCVLSPLTESTTTDQPETVKVESDPVSAKSKRGSRKTEKQDSPEGIQRKADHRNLMDYLQTQTGQTIINGAAQAGALKRILGAYTATQAQEVLDYQLAGNWRGPVSWLSVQTQIADYFRRKEQSQTKLGGNNGNYKSGSILQRLCNRRALGDFG